MIEKTSNSAPVVTADPLAAIACAVLADGWSEIRGLARSDEVQSMLDGLAAVGVQWSVGPDGGLTIRGRGGHVPTDEVTITLTQPAALAAMLPLLACTVGRFTLDCHREVNIAPLIDALRDLYVAIGVEGEAGRLTVNLAAGGLRGGRLLLPATIWPVLPALLVALPLAGSDVLVDMPVPPAEVGRRKENVLELMRLFGVETIGSAGRLIVPAPQRYSGRSIELAYT